MSYYRYHVQATMEIGRSGQKLSTESAFTVVGILDLNLEPEAAVIHFVSLLPFTFLVTSRK